MYIFSRVSTIRHYLDLLSDQQTIGFCPTMGALHEGHISLIRASKAKCDISVCSIFVNPTQFNDPEDLIKYPRNWSKDIDMLMQAGCDILFIPSVEEVYPEELDTKVDLALDDMTKIMEGLFRPGHFDGMMQVVNRLLNIVGPDRLFMGQKDFQQQAIVRKMIEELDLDVSLEVCPIVREKDGLAMSSRNQRLGEKQRQSALAISSVLKTIASGFPNGDIQEVKYWANTALMKAGLKPEYVEFCDGHTLEILDTFGRQDYIVCCIAAWAGNVRLIDNVILRNDTI